MKDKAFMKKLEGYQSNRDRLLMRRLRIDEELQAAKAADAASPRVKALQKELDECDAEFEQNRRETYMFVRKRLTKKNDGGQK